MRIVEVIADQKHAKTLTLWAILLAILIGVILLRSVGWHAPW